MTEKEDDSLKTLDQAMQSNKVPDPAVEWMPKMTRSEYDADMRKAANAALEKAGLDSEAAKEAKPIKTAGGSRPVTRTSDEWATLERDAKIGREKRESHRQKLLNMHPPGVVVTVRASDVVVRKKDWLWEHHLLRGSLELMTGIPNLGKSQIQCYWVACVTRCLTWPDGAKGLAEPMNVIMVTAEDSIDQEVVPRLIAAGADRDRVHILRYIRVDDKKRQFLLAEDLDGIEKAMARIGNVGLITIDPITAYMGGKMDANRTTEVRSQLGPLKDFSERVDIAVSAITHPAKNPGKRAIDHFIQSQAFIAAARLGHACFPEMKINSETGEDQATGRVLFTHVKWNPTVRQPTLAYRIIGGTPVGHDKETGEVITSSHVAWEKEPVNITADQAAASANGGGGQKTGRQSEVRLFLSKLLAGGKPVAAKEIMEAGAAAWFTEKQIRTAAKGLGVNIAKTGFDGGWEWTLPPDAF